MRKQILFLLACLCIAFSVQAQNSVSLEIELLHEIVPEAITNMQTAEWSPDGEYLAVGGDGGILLLDSDYEIVSHLILDAMNVFTINWSPDGTRLASVFGAIGEMQIAIINTQTGGHLNIDYPQNIITPIEWSPSGSRLVVGSLEEESVIILDGVTLEQTVIFQPTESDESNINYPIGACWDGEDEIIAIFGSYTYHINSVDGSLVQATRGGTGFSIECLLEESRIFIASGSIRSLGSSEILSYDIEWLATDVSIHPTGDYVAYNINAEFIQIWSTEQPTLLAETEGAMGEFDGRLIFYDDSIHWHPDGELLAAVGEDNILRVWRVSEAGDSQ